MASDGLPWGEVIIGALGGGGLLQVVTWWNARAKRNAYTMGAVDHAVETAMKLVTDRLERVERQHEECEAVLRDVNQRLDKSERERNAQKAEIDRLMAGPVATYGAKPPQD